jgi:DNA-binding NtrC family response regulator
MESRAYDLVLLDLMMPDRSGMDVLREVRERDRETPIFMITAYGSVEAAVEALKLGANDYFSKPWDNEKLLIEIDRMIAGSASRIREHAPQARPQAALQLPQHHRQERAHAAHARPGGAGGASSRSTILITGETGTGKELIAKAIHANSPRADQMFVAVNSGSLPPDLLESTLFGHEGRLHQRHASKKGYFEVADKGTIFFDEIGTIGPETQIKLLRVIQEKEFTPLGSTESHQGGRAHSRRHQRRPAQDWWKEGKFREDLYYRLNVINIALPPLRDRGRHSAADPALLQSYCRRTRSFWTRTAARCCASSRKPCRC